MFTDSHREMFATVGVQLRGEDGCTTSDIQTAEARIGIR
jgi:hypothetical protein